MAESDEPRPIGWHAGERAMQERIGVAEAMAGVRHYIRPIMTEQLCAFFPILDFVAIGSVDAEGFPWASLRCGKQGFIAAPDDRTLLIAGHSSLHDPAEAGLHAGAAIGLLGLQPHTRRRNRVNGMVRARDGDNLAIDVEESFGNCPKYIQARVVAGYDLAPEAAPVRLDTHDAAARAQIASADTLFIASYADVAGERRVDVSHRGGKPGFVRLELDGALTIPDLPGNRFFMTLGNLLVMPRAGLAFVDFETGTLLQMTGDAALLGAEEEPGGGFLGAERYWRFMPRRIVLRRGAIPLRMTLQDFSPYTMRTGGWLDEGREQDRI